MALPFTTQVCGPISDRQRKAFFDGILADSRHFQGCIYLAFHHGVFIGTRLSATTNWSERRRRSLSPRTYAANPLQVPDERDDLSYARHPSLFDGGSALEVLAIPSTTVDIMDYENAVCYSMDTQLCIHFCGGKVKEAGMRVRVEAELRDAFVRACKQQETTAAQVLRTFMRDYIEHAAYGRQRELLLVSSGEGLTSDQT